MNAIGARIDLPDTWRRGISAAIGRRRVVVLGPTDVGKTSFIRSVLEAWPSMRLVDLDPGQKMIGPPGTFGVGKLQALERFIFPGTTSASALSATRQAAFALAAGAEPLIVNTSGFVKGPGARLQAMIVAAIQPDLIIEIGDEPVLQVHEGEVLRLDRSPFARVKPPHVRAAVRQEALDDALDGSTRLVLKGVETAPAAPAAWASVARPICAIANRAGADMALGILERADADVLHLRVRNPAEPVGLVRLGKMWAEPREGRWRLLDRLSPAWQGG